MKKIIIYITSIIVIISVLIIYPSITEVRGVEVLYKDDWAIHNYGQKIESSVGINGIDINSLPARKIAKGNNEVIVAVVDTGIDKNCFKLKENIKKGWDFYNNDSTIYDEYIYDYHGTYVSGIIAKVAPNTKILPVKFMESTSGSVDDAVKAIEFAIDNGARIINCSWNYYDYSDKLYNIISSHPQVLFVCSAGNFNANLEKVSIYPCSYDLNNIINVMAIDNKGQIHSTSGYGKETIDIAAPGENVKVIFPENNETLISGTSVATAFVSAAAALLIAENENLTPNDIIEIINESAQPIESLKDKCVSEGTLDVYSALKHLMLR